MSCKPISVGLEVIPNQLTKIVFNLDKICNNDGTAEWSLHFQLQERPAVTKPFVIVVKLDVDINKENHPLAEATATNGLDEDQRGQAIAAAELAKAAKTKPAMMADAKQAAQDVLAARNPASPRAATA